MDPTKHVSKNKETGMYCVYNKKGEKVKEFKNKAAADAYATKNHDALMKEAKVYSKPAKLDPKIARHPKVKAAQRAHAKGDWDGNVDKEGDAVVHIMGKPYTVTKSEGFVPNHADKMKKKMMTPSDKDKLGKISQMLNKEKKPKKESINTADRKPQTYRKPDGKMGTRMVPTDKEVVKESTEVGETKWASVNMFAGGDKFGGRGVQISGLNGKGSSNMELVRQKGAYMQLPLKEVPKLIKLLQKAVSMKNEEVELDEAMTPAQKAAHQKAIAAFKARGGKITKLPPGKAAGYHGKEDPGHGVHGMLSKPDSGKFNTKKKVKSMTADTQKEDMQVYRIGHAKVQGNVHARDEKHATDILRKKGLKGPIRLTHRGPVTQRVKPQRRPLSNNTTENVKESVDMKSFFDVRRAATLDVNQVDEYYGGGGMSGFQGQANRNKYGQPHGVNPHHHDAHATAAYKSGMRSKSAIVKHVEKQTGQKIHPDVHAKIHNTPGMKD